MFALAGTAIAALGLSAAYTAIISKVAGSGDES